MASMNGYSGSLAPDGPAILVAGLGRCGSSLIMSMLDAAAIPTVGSFPSYEVDERVRRVPVGHAAKWIWTTSQPVIEARSVVAILAIRDHQAQSESMAKFGRMVLGVDGPAEAFRGPLASDTAQLRAALEQACESVHVVTFSRLVTDPSRTSRLLARWLRPHIGGAPDWRSMASRVRSRDPGCLPDMELERSLLDESLAGDVDA